LSRDGLISYPKPAYLEGRRVPAVDASDVIEKGRSGETYRLHYAIDLHTMTSDTFKITKEETGETLTVKQTGTINVLCMLIQRQAKRHKEARLGHAVLWRGGSLIFWSAATSENPKPRSVEKALILR
jgi:hypothetical protein